MLFDNLYEKILIEPLREIPELNNLLIISGYATAAMSFHFLNDISLNNELGHVDVQLVIGMASKDGLTLSNHMGFKKLVNEDDRFQCSYITRNKPVHSKIYVWCKDKSPVVAYAGSANYTQTALCLERQREAMTMCDAELCACYFHSLLEDTIYCNHPDIDNYITMYRDSRHRMEYQMGTADEAEYDVNDYSGLPHVSVSLLNRNENVPQRSGLNWGQRPEERREPNQAYIGINSDVCKSGFFPPRKVHFTVFTDDGKTLICTRAQDNGKAIQTPHNNSLIGEYFRNRLGVPNGVRVEKEHLLNYGRTDVTFYKIDDETYYMDYEPKGN